MASLARRLRSRVMRVVPGLAGAWAMSITRYSPAATRLSSPELLLDAPIESDTLPDEAEPALEAEEAAVLAAWAGRAQAAAKRARQTAREREVRVMKGFRSRAEWRYGTSPQRR
jgi:hypothetical protein